MYPRERRRWTTTFGRWVADYTVPRIVAGMSSRPETKVTPKAVYEWLRGRSPHPVRAQELVRLSGGRLTLDDIYRHPVELEGLSAPAGRRKPNDPAGS